MQQKIKQMEFDPKQTEGDVLVQLARFDNGTEVREYHLMLSVTDEGRRLTFQEQMQAIVERFEAIRSSLHASTVFKRYFLSDAANQAYELMSYELESPYYAISMVQQPPANGTKIALWCYLMTGVVTKANRSGLYEVAHGAFRHLWNGGSHIDGRDSEVQTRLLLSQYVMQLLEEGCRLSANGIRTWFFVNDIDNNYRGVVKARNDVFLTQGMTADTHFVASTAIGGRQAKPGILSQLDNYAVAGLRKEQVRYLYASDHLNRTSDYGVSFERGTAVDYGDRRQVFISSTASIDDKGQLLCDGDIAGQTRRVWENIEALLKEAGMTIADDIGQMIVYLRDPTDYELVADMFHHQYPDTPTLFVHAAGCRPGALVEMECMGVRRHDDKSLPAF